MSVLLHVTVFVLPAIWVIWICMMFQFRHAKLGATSPPTTRSASTRGAPTTRTSSGATSRVAASRAASWRASCWPTSSSRGSFLWSNISETACLRERLAHVLGARSPPLPRPLHQVIKWCFVLVTLPFALLPFSLILAAIWVLGSAILDPNQFLARTAAFAALVTTLTSIGNQLGAAAAKAASVRDQLRGRLSAVFETWLREHRDATAKGDDVTARAREQVAFAKQVAGANDDVQALCAVLDADGSRGHLAAGARRIVALLDVPTFDHAKVDQVFAYANENLDAVISPAEFEAAWTWVENEVVDAGPRGGLTDRFITAAIGTALVLLLGLFIFIFQRRARVGRKAARSAPSSRSPLIAATAFLLCATVRH